MSSDNPVEPAEEPAADARAVPAAVDTGERRPVSPRRAQRPPASARCSGCGGASLSATPTFSVGSGIAARPFAEDVICHGCGLIAPPALIRDQE